MQGKISQIMGAVVDVEFSDGALPKIMNALEVERKEDAGDGLYEVFNRVRESLVKGKYLYASSGSVNKAGTKTRKGREIKNFKQSIDVNKKLSELAFALV